MEVRKTSLPFATLTREEWGRLGDAAALLTLLLVMAFASYAVYSVYGHDFRGYYAAARVALAGGDPYDYRQVAPALHELTGYVGNNPYYYPPWFCLAMIPLVALFPFQVARGVWIAVNWALLVGGLVLVSDVLDWDIRGWRRWLIWLSAFYLFAWVSLKFEQLGIFLFFCLAWALWALRRGKDVQAGLAMVLLLTKPNVTALAFAYLALSPRHARRRAALWALIWLGILAGVGTLALPGWLAYLLEPRFGLGLTWLTDGPERVLYRRRLCTLLHWLEAWGITGAPAWILYGGLTAASLWGAWRSWRSRPDLVYNASLGAALTLLLTPYALLYDYPVLILGQVWAYRRLALNIVGVRRWISVGVLAFMFSVLIWAGPEYDGYWLALGMSALLLLLGRKGEGVGSKE